MQDFILWDKRKVYIGSDGCSCIICNMPRRTTILQKKSDLLELSNTRLNYYYALYKRVANERMKFYDEEWRNYPCETAIESDARFEYLSQTSKIMYTRDLIKKEMERRERRRLAIEKIKQDHLNECWELYFGTPFKRQ